MTQARDQYLEAQIEEIVGALRSYGVLTRRRLEELSGAESWRGPDFVFTLHRALERGEVRALGADLYELGPEAG